MTHNSRAFLALTVLAGLAASFLPATRAAMMAIDLGSEFLKISILKPGRIPISIVNNEMSKRKTPVAIAFVNKHRLVGDEAAALAARYPDRVITRLRDLLGKSYDDPELVRMFSDSHLAYSLVRAPNRTAGAAAIQTHTGEIYSAEELVASVLEYAKALATTAADGDPVTECVLVVPAFFSPAQRQALLDAASLAGLNVLSLVHAHAAAALQYGIERDFTNATQDVLFYDLGFGTAQAALVRFSTYGTGASAMQQLEVLDVAWVETRAGGDAMEAALIKHFAAQHSEPTAVLESPRAVARLRKQVKRTKEILSANTDAPISVEEMLPGVDFRGKISREEFEHALAAVGVWERAAAPVATILQRNNVTGADLAAVELLGGTSRVPRVKAALTEALGGRALDMHLDADEAVVMGAGLVAANLSTIFRLRKFGMTDKTPYQVSFTLEGIDEDAATNSDDPASAPHVLVPALKKIPTRRAIANHNLTVDSFLVNLSWDNSRGAALPCCVRGGPLGAFNVSGIAGVVEKHGYSGKVALHTTVDAGGVFKVEKADAAVEIEEPIEIHVVKLNTTTANDTASVGNATATDASAAAAAGAAADKEVKGSDAAANATADEQEIRTRRRMVRLPLKLSGVFDFPAMNSAEMLASRRALRLLRERDAEKRETSKARNDLEGYVINMRDKLENDEKLRRVSTEEQRDAVKEVLMDAEDWLYGDGEKATSAELRQRLKEVRRPGDEIENRVMEADARPAAVKATLEYIDLSLKTARAWPTTKPWLNATEAENVVKELRDLQQWIEEGVATQEKKAAHEEPAFKVADIVRKWEGVRRTFNRLNSRPKPIEKPPPAPVKVNETISEGGGNETEPGKPEGGSSGSDSVGGKEEGKGHEGDGAGLDEKSEQHDEL